MIKTSLNNENKKEKAKNTVVSSSYFDNQKKSQIINTKKCLQEEENKFHVSFLLRLNQALEEIDIDDKCLISTKKESYIDSTYLSCSSDMSSINNEIDIL